MIRLVSRPTHRLLGGLGTAVLLVLATLLLATASAGASDLIAYTCEQDICLINPDNPSEHSNITETDGAIASERAPSWSPDAGLIAYDGLYTSFGSYDLWTLDPTKSAAAQVATNLSESPERSMPSWIRPQWSPDGSRITYSEHFNSNAPPNLESEVYVSPFDGTSDPLPIGSKGNSSEITPTWLDNSTVLFSRGGTVYRAPANGSGEPTAIPNAVGYEPVVSPDGKQIATVTLGSPERIHVTNADGSNPHYAGGDADLSTEVQWSPDSTQLVYDADEEPLDQVRVVPADGSGLGHVIAMPKGWVVPHHAIFSPDGTRIAFDAYPTTGDTHMQVLVGPADGSSAAVPLTKSSENNEEPDWRPCEGCAPAAKPPAPPGGGGGGQGTGTKTPTTVRLAFYKKVYVVNLYMTPVFVDCNAQGGHPTGVAAEVCAARGTATMVKPRTANGSAAVSKKKAKKLVFATGKVRVPVGSKKPLKMKVTAAGARALRSGRTLSVKVAVTVTRPVGKPQTFTKKIKVALRKK
jgi:Tol biopolymer transport system component